MPDFPQSNRSGAAKRSAADNSFFINILRATTFDSIFYPDPSRSDEPNFFQWNNLEKAGNKNAPLTRKPQGRLCN